MNYAMRENMREMLVAHKHACRPLYAQFAYDIKACQAQCSQITEYSV